MAVPALTSAELKLMRDAVDDHLPGTAVIHAATKTADAQGGYTWTYAAASTVDARLSPEILRGAEREVGGRLAEVSPYILTVPRTASIDEDDRVVYNSVTYEVSEVLGRVPWDLCLRVRCHEVD